MAKKASRMEKATAAFNKKNTTGGKGKTATVAYSKAMNARLKDSAARRQRMGVVSRAAAGTKTAGARGLVGRGSALGQARLKALALRTAAGSAKAAQISVKMKAALAKSGLATVRDAGTKFSSGKKTKTSQTVMNRTGNPNRGSGLDRSK